MESIGEGKKGKTSIDGCRGRRGTVDNMQREGSKRKEKNKRGKNGITMSKLKCIYTNADSFLNKRLEF